MNLGTNTVGTGAEGLFALTLADAFGKMDRQTHVYLSFFRDSLPAFPIDRHLCPVFRSEKHMPLQTERKQALD